MTEKSVESEKTEKALLVITLALGDNPLRSIEECQTAKEAWKNLQQRYAGKTMINKLGLLNNFLNKNFTQGTNMGDLTAKLES